MGVFVGTLISVMAEETSALGVPTTMVVSTPSSRQALPLEDFTTSRRELRPP
jgi:hypothetical protein